MLQIATINNSLNVINYLVVECCISYDYQKQILRYINDTNTKNIFKSVELFKQLNNNLSEKVKAAKIKI